MKSYTVLRLLFFVTGTLAAFTQLTCTTSNECVTPGANGSFCYKPGASTRVRTSNCTEPLTQRAMANHIASSTSIGYYGLYLPARVGDHTFQLIRPVYVCMSGQLNDGSYQSVCSYASADNTIELNYCALSVGQPYVSDGCYAPDSSAAAVQLAQSADANSSGGSTPSGTSPGSSPSNSPSHNDASRTSQPSALSLPPLLGLIGLIYHNF